MSNESEITDTERLTEIYKNAERYLNNNPVLYAGLLHVIRRSTAEILEENEEGVFLRDTVSDCFMLATENFRLGEQWLKMHENLDYKLLLVFERNLVDFSCRRYALPPMLECFQAVYMQKKPPVLRGDLEIKTAADEDFRIISDHYEMVSEQELREIIRRGNLFIGFCNGKAVGFVGQHLEGSMGLLEVFPQYRGKGYGTELESFMISHMLEKELIPFCQVETDNYRSMKLQKKLGLTISEEHMYWLG